MESIQNSRVRSRVCRRPRGTGIETGRRLGKPLAWSDAGEIRVVEQKLEKRWVWPFELTRELGSGAMGKVYLAKYIKNGMQLAVKFLPPEIGENPTYLARFEREMEILRNMKHPHIVRCFGGTTQGKDQFYAMELVDGGSIYTLIKNQGMIPWRKTVEYGLQMCSALEYTHAQGVIHRDIKPGNFLLTKTDQIKLSDFGLALLTAGQHLTADGKTVGTLLYMSPEQISGSPPESAQSDLYALGCVFYEMLTGRPVFTALAAGKIIHSHLQEDPPFAREKVPEVPLEFDQLIQDLLKKKDSDRPASAAVVAERLRQILHGGDWGRVDTPTIGNQVLSSVPMATPSRGTRSVRADDLPWNEIARLTRWVPIATVILLQLLLLWGLGERTLIPTDVDRWRSLLRNSSAEVRMTAIRALEAQGGQASAALPELFSLAKTDQNPQVREAAAQAKERIQAQPSSRVGWLTLIVSGLVTIAAVFVGWKWYQSRD